MGAASAPRALSEEISLTGTLHEPCDEYAVVDRAAGADLGAYGLGLVEESRQIVGSHDQRFAC